MKGKHHSDDVKKLISIKRKEYYKTHDSPTKGKHVLEEIRLKITGQNNGMYGKNHTEEAKRKMSLVHKGIKQSTESINKRIKTKQTYHITANLYKLTDPDNVEYFVYGGKDLIEFCKETGLCLVTIKAACKRGHVMTVGLAKGWKASIHIKYRKPF